MTAWQKAALAGAAVCGLFDLALWWWLWRRKDADMKKAKYIVEWYRDLNREYRWRIRHRNGRIMADGGEGYRTKLGMQTSFRHLFAGIAAGQVELVDLTKPAK
jgi:uncharacterized protein YegP (UPF0339 family)